MRLKAEQLHSHLNRDVLAPVYCISGDEPLQLMELADAIRQRARELGFDERTILQVERGFDWNQLQQAGANLSLFSRRKIIDLRLGQHSPGHDGADALVEYAARPVPDNLLLISSERLDGDKLRSRWFKALEKSGVTIQVWPVEPARLPGWIGRRLKQRGKEIDRDAAELLAERVEGNLLAAAQEVDKLVLLSEEPLVSLQHVMRAVSDGARFNVFDLAESCLLGDGARVARMLRGMRQEGTELLAVLGAVLWELRRFSGMAMAVERGTPIDAVLNEYRVQAARRRAATAGLRRLHPAGVAMILRAAASVDRAAKGALPMDAWQLLETLLLTIAGVETMPMPINMEGRIEGRGGFR